MGDPRLIPIPQQAKLPTDVAVIGTSILGYFNAIPWSNIAALCAAFYTCMLILEKAWVWYRKRRK